MSNSKFKKYMLVVACVTTLVFYGCTKKVEVASTVQPHQEKQQTEVDKIKQAGKIILGTSADWPPSEFHKEINGKDTIVGYDISIAQEIAKDLGVQLEIKDMRFDGLLAALQTGNVDFVLSGMAPTEERKQSVDFSDIYHKGDQGVIIKTADKNKLNDLSDLKGLKIGVQKGSMQVKIAKTQIETPNLKELGKVSDLVLALKSDKVDAVLCGVEVAKSYAKNNQDITVMDLKLKAEAQGAAAATKKGNLSLLTEINKTIKRLQDANMIEKFVAEAQQLAE